MAGAKEGLFEEILAVQARFGTALVCGTNLRTYYELNRQTYLSLV